MTGIKGEPSFDALGIVGEPWTARLAVELLPENNGPKIEVFGRSVVVTPVGGVDHRAIQADLAYLVAQACRSVHTSRSWPQPPVRRSS